MPVPTPTIAKVVGVFLIGMGIYLLQWGFRKGVNTDVAIGLMICILGWVLFGYG
jgi:hypothetical protein